MSNITDDFLKAIAAFSGNPFDLLKGIKKLPPNRWDQVSIDGHHAGKVTAHDLGVVLPNHAWASWDWEVGDTRHALKVIAQQGAKDVEVELDGTSVDTKGRLQVKPIVQGFNLKISIRIHFVQNGTATEYRFDGKVS